jgi:endoglucanase Acf2
MRRGLIISSILAGVVIAIGCVILLRRYTPTQPISSAPDAPLVDAATLDKLARKSASTIDTSHLAATITPPTNSWLSGMVLQKTPLPVYPMPLSFLARDNGLEVGLPTVTSTPTTLNGSHVAGINAQITDATSFRMTRYDAISASLSYVNSNGTQIGTVTIAEGVPYVYYRSMSNSRITLRDITPPSTGTSTNYLRYTKAGHDYVVVANNGASITMHGTSAEIAAPNNSLVTFYALPDTQNDQLRAYAANEITAVTTSHHVESNTATTNIHYVTAPGKPTAYAAMSYMKAGNTSDPLASFETVYGKMTAVAGNDLITTTPLTAPSNRLDISHITPERRQTLKKLLNEDIAKTKISAQDSYYAGKQLARAANLLDLAHQLDDEAAANKLQDTLMQAMHQRLNGTYFYYDTKVKGVAATTAAFGSEDFNDHHFHYGYFIYAASILGKYDQQFLRDFADDINLLVADIAAYDRTDEFPLRRNYDAFAGHSWAAGLAPFADGNNQESSSEAMNAWNALAMWGDLTNNATLVRDGKWMLANEAETARQIWRSPPPKSSSGSANFTSPLTSLNFSGKRTYSTFFSDEPNAKFGIQLIPMTPFMHTLPDDVPTAQMHIKSSIENDNYNVALGDYILMYDSIYNPTHAAQLLPKQQDSFIDDGNSRTYLSAFIYSQMKK